MKKTMMILALTLTMVFQMTIQPAAAETTDAGSLETEAAVEDSTTAGGFATPREAATTYVEGFCEMNYDKMISACAVEPYVEGFNMEKYVERLQALLPISSSGTGGYLPYKDPMSYAINLNRRLGTLNEMILYQYLNLLIPGYGEDEEDMKAASLKDYDSAASLIEERYGNGQVPELTFRGEFIPAVLITDHYHQYQIQKSKALQAAVYGMDKKESVTAVIYIDGSASLLFLETCCYDGRWYVADTSSTVATIMGIPVRMGGLLNSNTGSGYYAEGFGDIRTAIPALLSNQALISAAEHCEEALLGLDPQLLLMAGESSREAGDNMIETTIRSALTPEELELLMNYKENQ